jgi:hypothetical protein
VRLKNLTGFLFFISLLTLLSGIIQTDGALAESEVVTGKLGFSRVAGRFEEHIILTKSSIIQPGTSSLLRKAESS